MGKKIFIFFVIPLLLIIIFIRYSPTLADSDTILITGEIVNVREKPGTTYSIITQIKKGETYEIKNQKDGWYEIKLPSGKRGWIANWLAQEKLSPAKTNKGLVTADHLNIRSEPNQSSSVVGTLKAGDEVVILNNDDDWLKIEYLSGSAWVSSSYIEIIKTHQPTADIQDENYITPLYNSTNIRKKPTLKSKILGHASSKEVYKVLGKEGDWYKIEYASGKAGYIAGWVITGTNEVSNNGPNAKTIVIDPGHGGRDEGAAGANGTLEKDLTMKAALLLSEKLKEAGFNVVLTRSSDAYVSLQDRAELAYIRNADVFISLHFDSIEDSTVHGHTTYYYYDKEVEIAEMIHNQISNVIQLSDRGVRFGDYYVLRENRQPSILLELGYLSNPSEEEVIKTHSYMEKITDAIEKGIVQYYSN
ncbi:N-acetylmuramoyl-L-alanine amidase [Lederbergia wuyishanensis]|uniref:N-acetylmuramoyl-L-alanine amidase n=1 Tax=Lederbergia wuyishanensis TaxID=1347903 RepID=A0ABU0D1N5_9BACI|nr:N-acetylmuramoyl-L-alanine amidase [Lederbergia wuyishanensis]MCJ8006937.1 N-acetylmuramoyl-L-alanine amidase [Lederbergia wuyishanensis]MDQ0342321.1 N-acetylmuramoyl-L-alanine amidase [Lederbergia wuyishanensis]